MNECSLICPCSITVLQDFIFQCDKYLIFFVHFPWNVYRDNQDQEPGEQYWLIEGETYRRRPQRDI